MKITVAIIEDELDIKSSLEILIKGTDTLNLVGSYSDGESAVLELPKVQADVVLTDIHLPGISGIECIKKLKEKCPKTNFLISSSFEDIDNIFSALKAGATGYLVKSTSPAKLIEGIVEVYQGGSPMNSHIARKVVSSFNISPTNAELEKLSTREVEILEMLSKGLRYKEIADRIFLSTDTVRTHIRNIYCKLQVNSRTDALNKVYKNHLS